MKNPVGGSLLLCATLLANGSGITALKSHSPASTPDNTVAHGPVVPPNSCKELLAHGPVVPPNSCKELLAHGPVVPPNSAKELLA